MGGVGGLGGAGRTWGELGEELGGDAMQMQGWVRCD